MTISRIVNLGELGRPLNGAPWATSNRWQLASKMTGDFTDRRMAKPADPSWSGVKTLNVELRTAQSVILGGDSTADALALAGGETDRALTTTAETLDASLASTSSCRKRTCLRMALAAAQEVRDWRNIASGEEIPSEGYEILLSDGWRSDPGTLVTGRPRHVVAIVDDGPKAISFVMDGKFNEGGDARQFGWGRFSPRLLSPAGEAKLKIGAGPRLARLQPPPRHFRGHRGASRRIEEVAYTIGTRP